MSSGLTVGERIIAYLSNYQRYQDDYDVPKDVSQEGISNALGISRAHAAIELKKLREGEEVFERLAHVRRGKTRRKVYFLTQQGAQRYEEIAEFARNEGMDLVTMTDIRRVSGKDLWESINDDQREIVAASSVFRRPFPKDVLPENDLSILPTDKQGRVDMPQELRDSIPSMVSSQDLRRYHSTAADYWLVEGDYRERLYHLLMAGRDREASMLVSSKSDLLLSICDEDVREIVSRLSPEGRYERSICYVQAEMARRLGDEDGLLEVVESMSNSEDAEVRSDAHLVMAMYLTDMDGAGEALELLGDDEVIEDDRVICAREVARAESGDPDAAMVTLGSAIATCQRKDLVLSAMGRVWLIKGDCDEAIRSLSKAMAVFQSDDRCELLITLSRAYHDCGNEAKAKEYASKVPYHEGLVD